MAKYNNHKTTYASHQPNVSEKHTLTSEFLPSTPSSSWTAAVTGVCHALLLDAWSNQAQLDSHDGHTQWGTCLARPKISNMLDFILTASWGEFLTPISPHTWRNGWANHLAKPTKKSVKLTLCQVYCCSNGILRIMIIIIAIIIIILFIYICLVDLQVRW